MKGIPFTEEYEEIEYKINDNDELEIIRLAKGKQNIEKINQADKICSYFENFASQIKSGYYHDVKIDGFDLFLRRHEFDKDNQEMLIKTWKYNLINLRYFLPNSSSSSKQLIPNSLTYLQNNHSHLDYCKSIEYYKMIASLIIRGKEYKFTSLKQFNEFANYLIKNIDYLAEETSIATSKIIATGATAAAFVTSIILEGTGIINNNPLMDIFIPVGASFVTCYISFLCGFSKISSINMSILKSWLKNVEMTNPNHYVLKANSSESIPQISPMPSSSLTSPIKNIYYLFGQIIETGYDGYENDLLYLNNLLSEYIIKKEAFTKDSSQESELNHLLSIISDTYDKIKDKINNYVDKSQLRLKTSNK